MPYINEYVRKCRAGRRSEREPADRLRDQFNIIGGWLPSLTFAFGDFIPVSITRQQTLKLVGLPLLSAAVTFVLLMVATGVVSGLSRPMQGESVSVSWPVCVLSSVAATTFLPWLISLPLLRQPGTRVYFLGCLAVATIIWYFVGFEGLLSKAYRRGL